MKRKAIVTGAGGGIGGACARALARKGMHVGLFDIDGQAAARTLAEIEAEGGSGGVTDVDCGNPDRVATAVDAFGAPDILVSGVALERHGGLLDIDASTLRQSFETTVTGAFVLIRKVVEAMIPKGGGRIVVISSPHAVKPFAGALAYNVAEAALRQLALTAAHELIRHGITVNLVEPGWTDTPGERRLYSEEFLAKSAALLPWGRRAEPDEIAGAIAYLTSDDARYVSGATLRVDGGLALSMARLPGLEGL